MAFQTVLSMKHVSKTDIAEMKRSSHRCKKLVRNDDNEKRTVLSKSPGTGALHVPLCAGNSEKFCRCGRCGG